MCALVMKGWREDRKEVVKERLESGDLDLHNLPAGLHNDIMDITRYHSATVSTRVEEVTQTEAFGDADGSDLRTHAYLSIVLFGVFGASYDHTGNLKATFRITLAAGRYTSHL